MDDVLSVLKFGWQESGQFFCFSTVAGEWTVFLLFDGSLIDSEDVEECRELEQHV